MTNVLLGIIAVLLWVVLGQLLAIKVLLVIEGGKVDALEVRRNQQNMALQHYGLGLAAVLTVIGYAVWSHISG